MNPSNFTCKNLSAALVIVVLLAPFQAARANGDCKQPATTSIRIEAKGGFENQLPGVTFPVQSKKPGRQEKQGKNSETTEIKHHSDEDKHKHHFYHYNKKKWRRKSHAILLSWLMRIVVAISYISILLCTFMSLAH